MVGVFGNTHGQIVDETYRVAMQILTSEYERTMMMELWQAICGTPASKPWLPGWTANLSSQLVGRLEQVFKLKTALSSEVLTTQADYTYYATADKAKREPGWRLRPLEQTFKEVLDDKLTQRKK